MNCKAPYADLPLVSVVITTKNEAKNIATCLQSIKLQTYRNIEIILVDNYSTDATCAIAKPIVDQLAHFGPERAAQRNHGMIDLAHGEYVIYIDADMLLAPNLITACVNFLQHNNFAALHISETVLGASYLSSVRRFERQFYDGTAIDGARFFRRALFCEVGGFDAKLFAKGSGEDWDIDKKIKQVANIGLLPKYAPSSYTDSWALSAFVVQRGVVFEPDYQGIYHNEAEFNLAQYLRKKNYYAKGFAGYIAKWGKHDPDIIRQFGLSYRYCTVFIENGKWRHLLKNFDKTLGMYFLRLLVGLVFLWNKKNVKTANVE